MVFRLSSRLELLHAAALYNFIKGGSVQNAMHLLKYGNRSDIAYEFGRQFGAQWLQSPHFVSSDIIIPIPLHYRKKQQRGYNQSGFFAKGISEELKVPYSEYHLIKTKELNSQTHKNREDRFDNVLDSFSIRKQDQLEGKTILLVDDVLTTGATVEAAYSWLSKIPNVKFQLGLIALADG